MTSADDYDPGEAPSVRVLYDGTPVARHGHTCDGCPMDRHIPAGTRYGKTVSLVDGEVPRAAALPRRVVLGRAHGRGEAA